MTVLKDRVFCVWITDSCWCGVIHPLYVDVISPHPSLSTPGGEPHSDLLCYPPKFPSPVIIQCSPVGIYFSFLLLMNTWAAFIWRLLWIRLLRPFLNASPMAHTHKHTCWVFTQEGNCQSQEKVCSTLLQNARQDDKWSHWYTVSPAAFDSSSVPILTGSRYHQSVRLAIL